MQTETYEVRDYRMPTVYEKVAKLNRRAVKLGLPEMELVVGEPIRREFWKNLTDLAKTVTIHHPVSVKGEYPIVDGWQLIAKINHDQGVNLIDISTNDDVSVWRDRAPECDHCHQKRISVKSYLIKNVEDDTIMGVGSGCLKDFIPRDTENMVRMFQFIADMTGWMEEESMGSWGGKPMYSVYDVLRVANLCVRKSGWVPSRSEDFTTAEGVWRGIDKPSFMDRDELREWEKYYTLEEKDGQAAVAFIDHQNAVEIKSSEDNFGILMKQLVKLGAVEGKFIPHLTGALAAFRRWEEKKLLKAKEAALAAKRLRVSEWVGEPKERREFKVLLEAVFHSDNQWGTTTICKLLDSEGHALTWFSSAGGFADAEVGDEFTIVGTVKSHGEYRDMKQTVITRCKVKEAA